ncbi:hypothetical protein B0H67DRAFT_91869 [Lasiosphaeris hirsuta]|uniref:Nudix hydrolase domain-containing protein n=1 Tax=Lasiosphaeris hirsuta TaxID=260670 RepID=A0AA40EBB5_9PEZI|nr:hypothetical protein B0H67DRAFT_91869 [Lasiosphaeris hirsuta]
MPPRLAKWSVIGIQSIESKLALRFARLVFQVAAHGFRSSLVSNIAPATKTLAVRKARQTRLPAMAEPSGQRLTVSSDAAKRKRAPLRPSASILILSPTNQVLLLHRVQTSTSFASAHVFPGGNLSPLHDGGPLDPEAPDAHQDSELYRLAAVRETFEESGLVLARHRDSGAPLRLAPDVIAAGRAAVHANRVRFPDWLAAVGAVPDTPALVPFTRWITPPSMPARFSTQMYLYALPPRESESDSESILPTTDGGLEHTAAAFADPRAWLARARSGRVVLFPPQFYLLHLVADFLTGPPPPGWAGAPAAHYQAQRDALTAFLRAPPQPVGGRGGEAEAIPWAEKVISPSVLFTRRGDGRVVLGLEKPGPELAGIGRGGDWERVVLVRFGEGGPSEVEVRWREEVVREEREKL